MIAVILATLSAPLASAVPNTLAQCLADKGAVMYSAWWCPACFAQLEEMKPSLKRNAMKNEQELTRTFPFLKECAEAETGNFNRGCPRDLKGIPTWQFADGSRLVGAQNLDALARKTGCPVPMQRK